MVKRSLLLVMLTLLTVAVLSSCSDGDSTQVQVYTEMTASDLRTIKSSGSTIQVGSTFADSLTISRVRILVSQMKMHRANEDETNGNRDVKTGPFIVTIYPSGGSAVVSADIADGNYDAVKFEIHKFSSSEAEQYSSDLTLKEFATDNRYTVFIDGIVYKAGKASSFVYSGDPTANLSLSLGATLTINSGSIGAILLRMNSEQAFKSGGSVLDPRDPSNANTIANAVKASIRALKK